MLCTNNYFIIFTHMETRNKFKLGVYFKNMFYKRIKSNKIYKKYQKF